MRSGLAFKVPTWFWLGSTVLTSCYNSGQICTTGSRLVTHRRIHDEFVDRLKAKLNRLRIGDPMRDDTKLGPIVSREQFDRVNSYVAIGENEYDPIVCGTRQSDLDKGFYVNPTVFDNVSPTSRIATEEIFDQLYDLIAQ